MYNLLKDGGSLELVNFESGKEWERQKTVMNSEEFAQHMIQKYVGEDIVFQNEINKFTGIDDAIYGNHENYSKRADLLGTPGYLFKIKQFEGDTGLNPTFNNIYFNDIENTEEEHARLLQGFEEYYADLIAKNPEKEAEYTKKKDYLKEKYLKVNGTDAGAYCTLSFWKQLKVASGEWEIGGSYDQAYNNYTAGGEWRDNKGEAPIIVPLKTSYDDSHLVSRDASGQGTVTRFTLKHGVIPLLRDWTSKHRIFAELHDRMNLEGKYAIGAELNKDGSLAPIDMANSESTNKGTLYQNNDLVALGDNLSKLKVLPFNSNSLSQPQTIPTDHHENPLMSSQFAKKIVENLSPEAIYKIGSKNDAMTVSGPVVKELFEAVVEERLNKAEQTLNKYLGLTNLTSAMQEVADSFNNPELDTKTAIEKFANARFKFLQNIKEALSAQTDNKELDDNYKKLLDIGFDKMGIPEFENPLFFPAYIKKVQQMLTSVVKNHTMKLRINGTSAVQVAELGGYIEDSGSLGLQMPIYSKKTTKDGTVYSFVAPAEIAISYEQALKMGLISKGEPLKVGDIIEGNPYALSGIGYRIPNAGKNMMMPVRIKYILPEGQSTAVIVPKGITQQMGSDFDIDKLYLMFPNTRYSNSQSKRIPIGFKYGDLISGESINKEALSSLSDRQLENVLISLSQSILTNPYHYEEMMSPLDSPTLPALVKYLKKKYKESGIKALQEQIADIQTNVVLAKDVKEMLIYSLQEQIQNLNLGTLDRHNPLSELELKTRSTVGGALIGISANNATGASIGNGLGFTSNYILEIENEEGTVEQFTELYPTLNTDRNDHPSYIAKETIPQGGTQVATTHSENLSSGTDNVKTPMAYMLNDNPFTSYAKTFLTQMGMGNNLAAELLTQPAIREMYKWKLAKPSATLYDACNHMMKQLIY